MRWKTLGLRIPQHVGDHLSECKHRTTCQGVWRLFRGDIDPLYKICRVASLVA